MHYKIFLFPDADIDFLWEWLEDHGVTPLYTDESETERACIATAPSSLPIEMPGVSHAIPFTLEEIDWAQQWEQHAPGFEKGLINIHLSDYNSSKTGTVSLTPGPGFGDLSHPTTQLVLRKLMELVEKDSSVIDIGCGSGILSLCAALAGATSVIGIDICQESLEHAQENAALNHLSQINFCLPDQMPEVGGCPLIAMNMIRSEQEIAWASLPQLHAKACTLITSGILEEEQQQATVLYTSWGFRVHDIQREGQWLSFTLHPF